MIQTLNHDQRAMLRELARAELARRSLHDFVRQAWHVIEPGKPFVDNWHLRLLCSKLEAVTRREIKRLIINVPPRSGKSSVVCALWPVWTWLHDPTHQWLTISHSGTFATRDALKSRRVIQSPWFQERWGTLFRLTGDQNQKTRYENDKRGYRIALGMTAGITGEGGDTILLDDPMDREAAHSDAERISANTTYDEAISTRLNEPATGAIVVIMQRLHVDDTTGHLLSGEEHWEHLCLPMEYEPDHPHLCAEDERTEPGEPLWPERFTPEVLEGMRRRLGEYGYAGQAQQVPYVRGGGVWPTDKITFWTQLPECEQIIQSWDFAAKETAEGSYTVGQVWGRRGAYFYLLDQFRARTHFNGMLLGMAQMRQKWPQTKAVLIEDKAAGQAVIESLRAKVPGIIAVKPEGGKEVRAEAVDHLFHAGNIVAPSPQTHPWVKGWLAEAEAFPNAPHDDQVDATSQALHYMDNGHKLWTL